jgi:DNA-binding ferritin-like protein (Dps family)
MTMFLTRMTAEKRRYRQYKARTKRLPASYRTAVDALERYLMVFGPSDGDSLSSMLEDLADLFEQSAASGTSVRAIVGEDPLEFATAFLRNYPEGWTGKERERLTSAVERAVREDTGDAEASR